VCGFIFYLNLYLPLFSSEFSSIKEGWSAAIAATSREDFFSTAKEADPCSYMVMYDKLEYFADKHFTPPVKPFVPIFTDFVRVPEQMRLWVQQEMHKVCEVCSTLPLIY
jgi:hypothetical protein